MLNIHQENEIVQQLQKMISGLEMLKQHCSIEFSVMEILSIAQFDSY